MRKRYQEDPEYREKILMQNRKAKEKQQKVKAAAALETTGPSTAAP